MVRGLGNEDRLLERSFKDQITDITGVFPDTVFLIKLNYSFLR